MVSVTEDARKWRWLRDNARQARSDARRLDAIIGRLTESGSLMNGPAHPEADLLRRRHWPKPESTEGRPWGQPLKKLEGAPLNLG